MLGYKGHDQLELFITGSLRLGSWCRKTMFWPARTEVVPVGWTGGR